jgi:hypothetical protein
VYKQEAHGGEREKRKPIKDKVYRCAFNDPLIKY